MGVTVADMALGLIRFIVFPLHFGTDEFCGWKSAAQMGFTFLAFHWQGRGIWTTGDSFAIRSVVGPLDVKLVFRGIYAILRVLPVTDI